MKTEMRTYISTIMWALLILLPLMTYQALAQDVPPAGTEVGVATIITDLISAVGSWKSLGWQVGLASILTLIISTLKNSVLRTFIWDKLGWAKILVAPVLSLILVALTVSPFTPKAALFAFTTGVGAIALGQLLKAIRDLPFVGEIWKKILDGIGKFLKKPKKDLLENREDQ